MTVVEAARVIQRAQTAVISHYAQRVHAQYVLTLEALINRYRAHLWLTYDDAFRRVPASQAGIVKELQDLGHGYIELAAALGYERALRDLTLTGWIKWYSQPVKAPYASYQDAIAYNDKYLRDSFGPDLKPLDPVAMRPRIGMYSHYLWRVAEAAYKYCIQQYRQQIGTPIRESLREQDDEDDGDFAAVFAGPDDSETCDGCDEAVNGNPYTVDTVPDPGSFECMNRCRHFVQLSEDAPDDLAPYEWHGMLGFGSLPGAYYEGVVRDQDLLPRWNVDESRFGQSYAPSTDGIALPHLGAIMGDLGPSVAPGRVLPGSYDILSDQLGPALQKAQDGDVEGLAQWLWDAGMTPALVEDWVDRLVDFRELQLLYNDIQDNNATLATVLTWIRRGDVDRLIDVVSNSNFARIMQIIAQNGFPAADAFAATVLSEVLGLSAEFDTVSNRWMFDVSSTPISEAMREDHWVTIGGEHILMKDPAGWSPDEGAHFTIPTGKQMTTNAMQQRVHEWSDVFEGVEPKIEVINKVERPTEAASTKPDASQITFNMAYRSRMGPDTHGSMTENVLEHEYAHAVLAQVTPQAGYDMYSANAHHDGHWQQAYQMVHDYNVASHDARYNQAEVKDYFINAYENFRDGIPYPEDSEARREYEQYGDY